MVRLSGEADQLRAPNPAFRPVEPYASKIPSAIADLGSTITESAAVINDAYQKEKERIDKTVVEDAFTQLRNKQIDLSIGKEKGFSNVLGGDAVKRPILKEWTGMFDDEAEKIASSLSDDNQRQAFRRRVDVAKMQFSQDILQHVQRENKQYQSLVLDSTSKTETNFASLHWDNPDDALASKERVKAAVGTFAEANGIDGEAKKTLLVDKYSKLHSAVIEGAVNNGNPEYAKLWLKSHRDEINSDAANSLERLVKEGADRAEEQKATDELLSKYSDEKSAKEEARKRFTGKKRDNVIERLSKRYSEIESIKKYDQNSAADEAWKTVVSGKEIDDIPPTTWVRMSGVAQKQVTEYIKARDRKDRQEDDWQMLDEVDNLITQGDITDTSQLLRYQPFFKDSTFRSLRKKVEKRGTISATVVQRAFEDRLGKTRSKWKDGDRSQWVSFQNYILDNVKETKRPEDVDSWADRWFMEGYGSQDTLFTNDPDTYGEAVTKGRQDFVIPVPEEISTEVNDTVEMVGKAGISVNNKDEFYTQYYLDGKRWMAARDMLETPDRMAAYAILKQNGQPLTEANIDYVSGQLR